LLFIPPGKERRRLSFVMLRKGGGGKEKGARPDDSSDAAERKGVFFMSERGKKERLILSFTFSAQLQEDLEWTSSSISSRGGEEKSMSSIWPGNEPQRVTLYFSTIY